MQVWMQDLVQRNVRVVYRPMLNHIGKHTTRRRKIQHLVSHWNEPCFKSAAEGQESHCLCNYEIEKIYDELLLQAKVHVRFCLCQVMSSDCRYSWFSTHPE